MGKGSPGGVDIATKRSKREFGIFKELVFQPANSLKKQKPNKQRKYLT